MTNLVADWTNFALLTGGAAGAMVGLLFVAVSIRADAISQSRAVSSRISQVLTIFLGLLSASLMVSLPDLSNVALGVLLIVAAVCMGATSVVLDRHARGGGAATEPLAKVLDVISPDLITAVLMALSGLGLILGLQGSLLLLALAAILGFVGAIGAWVVLIQPTEGL